MQNGQQDVNDLLDAPQQTSQPRDLWVENGPANDTSGSGAENDPYKNLRTALANARPGDTIKLKGDVTVTGSDTSVVIDKAVTIEGNGHTLRLRGQDVEIAADVTMQNLNLVILKDSGASGDIHLGGNQLILDNVTTKISDTQTGQRPNIITGTKADRASGPKAHLVVRNATDETRFKSIIAGDPDTDSATPVVIELDSAQIRVEDGIHLSPPPGGTVQTGTVDVTTKSNFVTAFHNPSPPAGAGARSITFAGATISGLSVDDVDNLTLTQDARISLGETDKTLAMAGRISLDQGTVLDLTDTVTTTGEVTGSGLVRIGDEASFESNTTAGTVSYEVYRGDFDYRAHVGKAYVITHDAGLNPSVTLLPTGAPYRLVEDAAGTWSLQAVDVQAKVTPTGTVTLTSNGQPRAFGDGDFAVTVMPSPDDDPDAVIEGVPTGEVPVTSQGRIDLGTWTFDTPGTYVFTVSQVDKQAQNVTYDTTPVMVTVIVEENPDPTNPELVATLTQTKGGAPAGTISFANTFAAPVSDADGDQVADDDDLCDATPAGARVGPDGCAVAPELGQGAQVNGTQDTPITPVLVPVTNDGRMTVVACTATGLPDGLTVAWSAADSACVISGTPTVDTTENAPLQITLEYTRPDAGQVSDRVSVGGTVTIRYPAATIDPTTPFKQDDDGDGVTDDVDTCAATPAGAAVDATGCAVPPTLAAAPEITGQKDTAITPVSVSIVNPDKSGGLRCVATGLPAGLQAELSPNGDACIISGTPTEDTVRDQPYTLTVFHTPADGGRAEGSVAVIGKVNITIPGTPLDPPIGVPEKHDITGRICEDLDGDAACGLAEPDISGVTVELLDDQGVVVTTARTSSAGYTFTGVTQGNYTIRIATTNPVLDGFTPVSAVQLTVQLDRVDVTGQNFAYRREATSPSAPATPSTPGAPSVAPSPSAPGTSSVSPSSATAPSVMTETPRTSEPTSVPEGTRSGPRALPATGARGPHSGALGLLVLAGTAIVGTLVRRRTR